MRLDKFISQYSDYSRSQIQLFIKKGLVSINGEIAKKGDQKIQGNENILLDNEPIEAFSTRYLMLHKPAGYVCANSDGQHPTVLDLIHLPHKQTLQIVGRLDVDTTGLVLLTDDGQWNHRVTSPRHHCIKTYRVTTAEPIDENLVNIFLAGVQLHGEAGLTLPADLKLIDRYNAYLNIHEGKYHQVKRMFAAVGNRVLALHRNAIGGISLDETLALGQYRALTPTEIEKV